MDGRFLGDPLLDHGSFLLICFLARVLFVLFFFFFLFLRDAKFNHITESHVPERSPASL